MHKNKDQDYSLLNKICTLQHNNYNILYIYIIKEIFKEGNEPKIYNINNMGGIITIYVQYKLNVLTTTTFC